MKESEIQKDCLAYLCENDFFAWRNHVQGVKIGGKRVANPAAGSPDIFALKNGSFYAIEVKTAIGTVSPHQYKWLQKAHVHGAISMVVRSVEDLIECLCSKSDTAFDLRL